MPNKSFEYARKKRAPLNSDVSNKQIMRNFYIKLSSHILFACLLSPTIVWAFGSFSSEHEQLKNKVIVAVGEAKKVDPPSGAEWKEQVYSLGSYCFTMSGYYGYWGYGGKPAMLVVNDRKLLELAIFETFSSDIDVKLNYVTMIQCPAHANITPSCDGLSPDQCKTLMDAYLKKLKQKLKELSK